MDGATRDMAGNSVERQERLRYLGYALTIALAYSLVHIVARMLASPNLGEDDPLINIHVQQLALGYDLDEPPLFAWLIYGVQQFTGPTLVSFQVVKYAFLVATIGMLYSAAYQVTRNPVWSLVTAEALTLIYHVGWRFHEGFAGLVPAMFFSTLALVFVLRIFAGGRVLDFAGLGVAFGLGLLSQHSFVLTIATFITAALVVPDLRRRLLNVRLIVSVVVAGMIVAPHYWWIVSDAQRWAIATTVYSAFDHPSPRIDFWRVVRKTAAAPIGFYWSLLVFLLVAAFGRVVVHFRHRLLPEITWTGRPVLQFLGWYGVAAMGWLFVAGLAVSHVTYAYHDLLALLLPTLVLLFALIQLSEPSASDIRRWAAISLGIIAFAFVARAANMFVMEPFCKICRWGIPYAQLANSIRKDGFEVGQVVALEPDLAGNLRMYFSQSQVGFTPVGGLAARRADTLGGRGFVVVWQVGGKHGLSDSRETMRERLKQAGIDGDIHELRAPWRHVYRADGYRETVWNYVIGRGR